MEVRTPIRASWRHASACVWSTSGGTLYTFMNIGIGRNGSERTPDRPTVRPSVRPTNRPTDRCRCTRCVDRRLCARVVSDSCSSTRTASKKLETFHVTMLRFQCGGCQRGFCNVEGFMNHLWDRDDSSPCVVYGSEWALAELAESKAAYYRGRGYSCCVCHSGFKTREDLDNHLHSTTCGGFTAQQMEARWEAEKPWKCPTCRKTFRTETDRDQHVDAVHSGKTDTTSQVEYLNQYPWTCSRCLRRFRTKAMKDNHEWHCREAHEYVCQKTPEEIASDYQAWKPYVCDFRDNRFETQVHKDNHEWHCGNKRIKPQNAELFLAYRRSRTQRSIQSYCNCTECR